MDEFKEKLQSFLDDKCVGDWANCVECPDSYHIDGACTHPDHPSMQPVNTDFIQVNAVHPAIAKVFHDIRNTYQSVIMLASAHKSGEKSCITPEQIMDRLDKDLKLMAEAEATCRICGNAKA